VKQHEIKRPTDSVSSEISENPLITGDVAELRMQLHKAHRQIARLAQDKQVLIELGNRLRAQLIHNGQLLDCRGCSKQNKHGMNCSVTMTVSHMRSQYVTLLMCIIFVENF
jgi:hypothetical protein